MRSVPVLLGRAPTPSSARARAGRGCRLAAAAILTAALGSAAGCAAGDRAPEPVGQARQAVDMICNEPAAASLDGFPAYPYCGNFDVYTDNGVDTQSSPAAGWTKTEGGYGYQCVEWAVRYFYFKWGVSKNWFVGYAKDMCGTHPADVSVTNSPVHGDLAVIIPGCGGADPTAGHVVAIDTVSGSSYGVVQQNPAGTGTWHQNCVACFLHAAGNGGMPDPCSSAPVSGLYCGQSPQWGGGTPDVLYDCEGGVTKSKTPCPYGCHLAPPNVNDSCNPAPPTSSVSTTASSTTTGAGGGAHGSGGSTGSVGSAGSGGSSMLAPPPQGSGGAGGEVRSGTGGAPSAGGGPTPVAVPPEGAPAMNGGCAILDPPESGRGGWLLAIAAAIGLASRRGRRRA